MRDGSSISKREDQYPRGMNDSGGSIIVMVVDGQGNEELLKGKWTQDHPKPSVRPEVLLLLAVLLHVRCRQVDLTMQMMVLAFMLHTACSGINS